MKKLAALAFLLSFLGLSAQTADDISLFQVGGLHGSPRYVGLGGAFMALGNDFSSLHINPAGAAVFRNDNFGISLGLQNQRNEYSFLETQRDDAQLNGLFQNIGVLKKFGRKNNYAFGFTYGKMADFSTEYTAIGVNKFNNPDNFPGYTLGEYWFAGAENRTLDELEQMGFLEEASALDATVLFADSIGVYAYDYNPDDASDLVYDFQESGNFSEAQITFGGQPNEMFYYGFALGFPIMNYANSSSLSEGGFATPPDSIINVAEYSLNRNLVINANGINLKAGIIYKPVQYFRLGVSYQSPSWYAVNALYSVNVNATLTNGEFYSGTEYIVDDISYGLTTPAIYRTGMAFVIEKSLILSADYEYKDPAGTSLRSRDGVDYEGDEAIFRSLVQPSSTIKTGIEWRIGPVYVRGGFQFRQSIFEDKDLFQSNRKIFSFGGGFKKGAFGVDIAYALAKYSHNYFVHPFLGDDLNPANGNGISNPERTLVTNDVTKGNFIIGINVSF